MVSIFQEGNRKRIRIAGVVFLLIFFASFLIERFGFGLLQNPIPKNMRGVLSVEENTVFLDGFIANGDGGYTATRDGATMTILASKYVYDLRLDFKKTIELPLSVSFRSIDSEEENMVENELQKFMIKREESFGNFLIWHIGTYAETITIQADRAGTEISGVFFDNEYPFNVYRFGFLFGFFLLFGFLFIFWRKIAENPEIGFLFTAILCGSVLIYCSPKNAYTWDEKIHYQSSEKIAYQMHAIPFRSGTVPFSYSLKEQNAFNSFVEEKYKIPKKDPDVGVFLYPSVGYLPSVAGLTIGELVPFMSHTEVFLFGRWMNLILYSFVVFFAIRKLQSGKLVLSVIALFPTALFLASNYHYDGWTIAFVTLGCAYVFGELQEPKKKTSWRAVMIMIGAFVLGLGSKGTYFPLIFLPLLIGISKFSSIMEYRKYLGVCFLGITLVTSSFWVPLMIKPPIGTSHRGEGFINGGEQLRFIFSDPVAYAEILGNFFKEYLGWESWQGFVTSFAYLGSINGFWVIIFVLGGVLLFDRKSCDISSLSWKKRVIIVVISFGTVALIATGLYIIFTAVRSQSILGVQPRYMLPLLFPFLYAFGFFCIPRGISWRGFPVIVYGVMGVIFMIGVWDIIVSKYY